MIVVGLFSAGVDQEQGALYAAGSVIDVALELEEVGELLTVIDLRDRPPIERPPVYDHPYGPNARDLLVRRDTTRWRYRRAQGWRRARVTVRRPTDTRPATI